jgi:PAS domain S-box-containing protein
MSCANGAAAMCHRAPRLPDMNEKFENPAEEVSRLQRCINDLTSFLALPAIWTGGDASQIGRTLLDVLLVMLRLDLVYVRLGDSAGAAPIEMVRASPWEELAAPAPAIGEMLGRSLGADPLKWESRVSDLFGNGDISLVPMRLGLQGEIGVIVVGSRRAGFPGQTERLLLGVAANQAAIGLQDARLLSEQTRVAGELDRQVAQRTRELAAANEGLRLQVGLLQEIPVAAWTLGPDGTPDFVNRVWLEYTGQTLDHVQSGPQAWMSALHPDDRESVARSYFDGIRSGQGFTMEARFRRVRDGAYRWHLNRAVPLRDAEGKLLKFVGTSTDIEDLKQSQGDLRTAEETTRLIIDSASDAVVTMDAEGTITTWNKQAEIIFGWSIAEAVGRRMSDMIIPARDRPAHERGLRHFLATGEGPILRRRIEVTAVRRGGDEFPVDLEVVPTRLGAGWVFSAFIRDITDWKQAQEELRGAQAELAHMTRVMTVGELTASIAHEVNQPLSGIITNASTCLRMLAADPPNVDGARETARRTIRDGNRASEVIARLRALFSRREAASELVDLNEATREVIALSSNDLQRNRVIVRTELADDLAPVTGDRVQLQQVILNLLRNAADAMSGIDDRPRQLLIRTERAEGDQVRLTVRDAGVGLDPQAAERLFKAFYTTKRDGMGIGLSISRTIIESHHGRIWAAPNDGPGATFAFSIPRRPQGATGAHGPDIIPPPPTAGPKQTMRFS